MKPNQTILNMGLANNKEIFNNKKKTFLIQKHNKNH